MEIFTVISFFISLYVLVKVHKIESSLDKSQKTPLPLNVPPVQQTIQNNEVAAELPVQNPTTSISDDPIQKIWAWYSHEWPLKTGALFILMGIVWFVSYAFLNNWIGPVGRITLGLCAGILILFFGERRLRVVQTQGITLVGLGGAISVFTVYAAQATYHMLPPAVALGFIVIVMTLTAAISLRYKILSLAIFSLLIGGLAPILIGSKDNNIAGLYGYLLAVAVSFVWISRYSKWRILTLLSLLIVSLYSLPHFFPNIGFSYFFLSPIDIFMLRFFATTFISLFFFTNLLTLITNKKTSEIDLITAGGIGFFTLAWINGLVPSEYKGLVCVMAALLYAVASYLVYKKTNIKATVYIYTAIAALLLSLATAFQFDGPTLLIAFSIEAVLLPIVGVSILGPETGKYLLLYFLVPAVLSLQSISSSSWKVELSVVTVSFLISGLYFYNSNKEKEKPLHDSSIILIVMGSVYGLIWIWRMCHMVFDTEYIARMASLLLYSIVGLTAYVMGEMNKRSVMDKFGRGLLIFVIARLLIVEVWEMELSTRIITFFLIGFLFIGSVLLRKRK